MKIQIKIFDKLYDKHPTLTCYLRLILGCTLVSLSFFFVEWLLDILARQHMYSVIFIFIPLAAISIFLQRKNVQIIISEKIRNVIYYGLSITIIVGSVISSEFVHSRNARTIEVKNINEALNTPGEFFHLSEYAPIDINYKGINETYEFISSGRRHSQDIEFVAYVVQPFKESNGAFLGYCLSSKSYDYNRATEEESDKYRYEFHRSINGKKITHSYSDNDLYLRRLQTYDSHYDDYMDAVSRCEYIDNLPHGKREVFIASDTKNEESKNKAMKWFLIITLFVVYPIVGLLFRFSKKRFPSYKSVDDNHRLSRRQKKHKSKHQTKR